MPTLTTFGAAVTATSFAAGIPYVIGRKVAPPVGTVLRVVAEDIATAYVISEDGRCEPADSEGARHAAVTLELNRAALTLLCAGRRTFATLPDDAEVTIEGDRELGIRILDAMTLLP